MTKVCSQCQEEKSAGEFWKDRRRKSGLMGCCKSCRNSQARSWRAENRDKDRARYWKDKDATRNKHLARKYGISIAEYRAMFEAQGGLCRICKTAHTGGKLFDVDHCHTTGKVRGLLCSSCNRMLGHAKDRTETLAAAIEYLRATI